MTAGEKYGTSFSISFCQLAYQRYISENLAMSQFGVLAVTDKHTVTAACRGWAQPLADPKKITSNNPFTGEVVEFLSYTPDNFDDYQDCASLEEVGEQLRNARPVAFDFQSSSLLRKQFLDDSKPVFIGNTAEGTLTVEKVPTELEGKVVEYFGEELGEYADDGKRRRENLSIFFFIDSF